MSLIGVLRHGLSGSSQLLIRQALPAVQVQVCGISGCHGKPKEWPSPYPGYADRKFNLMQQFLDNTKDRLSDDSKMVVVEGMVGSGKTQFSQQLAKELDYHFVPAFDYNSLYVTKDTGFDIRTMEWKVGDNFFYDLQRFYTDKNPQTMRAGGLQLAYYQNRFYQYAKALLHILSTGQGVVMDTSVFSDDVYAKALYQNGYMSRNAKKHYNMVRDHTICELFKPHVTIFLDVPLDVVKQRIAEKYPLERDSVAMKNPKYLEALQHGYQHSLMKEMGQYGEVLHYGQEDLQDWEIIVEELEQMHLEYEKYVEYKFEDWNRPRDADWAHFRKLYSNDDALAALFTMSFPFECKELYSDKYDYPMIEYMLNGHPEIRYRAGFNPEKNPLTQLMAKM